MRGYSDTAVQKQVGAMYKQTHGEEVLRFVSSPLSWFHLTAPTRALLPDHIQGQPAEHSLHRDL